MANCPVNMKDVLLIKSITIHSVQLSDLYDLDKVGCREATECFGKSRMCELLIERRYFLEMSFRTQI